MDVFLLSILASYALRCLFSSVSVYDVVGGSHKPNYRLMKVSTKTFDDLEGDFCRDEVHVRLIHFWEARNFKHGNILMGVELLLIDTKSTTMQAFIATNRLARYNPILEPGAVYSLKNFMINPSKKLYRVSPHKHGISFTDQTAFVDLHESHHSLATQKFRLRLFKDLAGIADRNIDLFDIIGHIRLISGDNLNAAGTMSTAPEPGYGRSKDKVFLHVQMEDGETVRVYLWDKIAATFRSRWNESASKPVVLLLTTVNPRTVGGVVTMSSTSSTRLFFDTDIDETKNFLKRLDRDGHLVPAINSSAAAVVKLETVTLNDIHQFIHDEAPQVASFICIATIVDVFEDYGWNYISCTSCKTKMVKSETSVICTNTKCKNPKSIGLIRYRFEVSVRDESGLATFVIFDQDGSKLTGRSAAEVSSEMTEGHQNDGAQGSAARLPQIIRDIIGRTCKFQVKTTPYNFSASRQTLTVSRIIEDNIVLTSPSGETEDSTPATKDRAENVNQSENKDLEENTQKRPRLHQ